MTLLPHFCDTRVTVPGDIVESFLRDPVQAQRHVWSDRFRQNVGGERDVQAELLPDVATH